MGFIELHEVTKSFGNNTVIKIFQFLWKKANSFPFLEDRVLQNHYAETGCRI